ANMLKEDDKAGIKNKTITIGRRAAQFVARLKDTEVLGAYQDLPDRPDGSQFRAILDDALAYFKDGTVDAVDIVYTDYINSLLQEAKTLRILPAGFDPTEESANKAEATYEPNVDEVLN